MSSTPVTSGTILFVDDEVNVLQALERVFFGNEEVEILTAESGAAGLDCIQAGEIDVVVSDQKMPGMSGAGFLKQVREISPHTRRIMLTGYRDHDDTVEAINEGGIHQYLNKPWDDDVMRSTVLGMLELRLLEKQNRSLRSRVTGISRIASDILRLVSPQLADHGDQTVTIALCLGKEAGLKQDDLQTLELAARHHDIGLLSLPPKIRGAPAGLLEAADGQRYRRHPELGQKLMAMVPDLQEVGLLIRHHHEHWDGNGFPFGLAGKDIPKGARIIAVASHWTDALTETGADFPAAREIISRLSGTVLDPEVVALLEKIAPKDGA